MPARNNANHKYTHSRICLYVVANMVSTKQSMFFIAVVLATGTVSVTAENKVYNDKDVGWSPQDGILCRGMAHKKAHPNKILSAFVTCKKADPSLHITRINVIDWSDDKSGKVKIKWCGLSLNHAEIEVRSPRGKPLDYSVIFYAHESTEPTYWLNDIRYMIDCRVV